jgi:hypothetical protein
MKVFSIALAVAGTVAAGSAGAQALPRSTSTVYQPTQSTCSYSRSTNTVGDVIFGRSGTASNCQDVYSREDGAWYQVGRGANNNSIYERRVTDSRGNLIIQRARRNPNGSFTIMSSRTANANDKQWKKAQKAQRNASRQDCTYTSSTNSVGDIVFGRSGSNTTNCVDNRNTRVNGGWYPVGNDGSGAAVYERQTRDSNGNLIIQRARRDRNGNLSIISTRNAGNTGTYDNRTSTGRYENGQYNNRSDDGNDDRGNGQCHGKGHGKGKGHGRD